MATPEQPINLFEFEDAAKELLPKEEYDYIAAAPPTRSAFTAIGVPMRRGRFGRGCCARSAGSLCRRRFWGLAVGGEQGVMRVLNLLLEEIEITMAKCGRPTIVKASPL